MNDDARASRARRRQRGDPSAATGSTGGSAIAGCAIIDLSEAASQPMRSDDGTRRRSPTTARSTTSASCAPSSRALGAPLPLPRRHRGRPARLRGLGRRRASRGSTACSRSRSGTRAAAGCCSPATAPARSRSSTALAGGRLTLRLRDQGAARLRRGSPRDIDPTAPRRVPDLRLRARAGDDVPRHPAGPARGHGRRSTPTALATRRAPTGSALPPTSSGPAARPAGARGRSRAAAATRRRASAWSPTCRSARCCRAASTRRSWSGSMARASTGAGAHVLDRLPGRAGVRRALARAAGRRALRHRAHRVRRHGVDAVACSTALLWHHDQPFADSSAIPTYLVVAAGARARDVVAQRRRRRRGLRRLRPLPRPRAIAERCPAGWPVALAARAAAAARSTAATTRPAPRAERFLERAERPLVDRYQSWIAVWPRTAARGDARPGAARRRRGARCRRRWTPSYARGGGAPGARPASCYANFGPTSPTISP